MHRGRQCEVGGTFCLTAKGAQQGKTQPFGKGQRVCPVLWWLAALVVHDDQK